MRLLLALAGPLLLGCSSLAFADTYTYSFSDQDSIGQSETFTYTSPTFISSDLVVPAAALSSCTYSQGYAGQACTSVEFNAPANILNFVSTPPPHAGYGVETDSYENVDFAVGDHVSISDGIGGTYTFDIIDNPSVAATPEPSSLILLSTGALGMIGALRRRIRTA